MSRLFWFRLVFWGLTVWAQPRLDWESFEGLFQESLTYQMRLSEAQAKKPLPEEALSLSVNVLGIASPVDNILANPLPQRLGLRGGLRFQKRSFSTQLQGGLTAQPSARWEDWKQSDVHFEVTMNLPFYFTKGITDSRLKERIWVWEQRKSLMTWRFEILDLFQDWLRAHNQINQAQKRLKHLQERASILKQFAEAQLIPKFKFEEAYLEWQTQRQLVDQLQRDYQHFLSHLKTLLNFDLSQASPELNLPLVKPQQVLTLPEELEAQLFDGEVENSREGLAPQLQVQLGFYNNFENNEVVRNLEIQLGILMKLGASTEREEAQLHYLQLRSRSSRLQWEQLLGDYRHQQAQFQIQEREWQEVIELRQTQLNSLISIQQPTDETWERRWELEKAILTAEENLQHLRLQHSLLVYKFRILCDAIGNL